MQQQTALLDAFEAHLVWVSGLITTKSQNGKRKLQKPAKKVKALLAWSKVPSQFWVQTQFKRDDAKFLSSFSPISKYLMVFHESHLLSQFKVVPKLTINKGIKGNLLMVFSPQIRITVFHWVNESILKRKSTDCFRVSLELFCSLNPYWKMRFGKSASILRFIHHKTQGNSKDSGYNSFQIAEGNNERSSAGSIFCRGERIQG